MAYDLSIIIPHYNSVKTLILLLDTIPVKKNIEIIIVDDKSDVELKILTDYIKVNKNKNINFLKNITNSKGAGVCRNLGIKEAEGKWILFADSDDYFLDSFYSIFSEYNKTKYDVIFFTPTSVILKTGEKADRHIHYENLINEYLRSKELQNLNNLKYKFYAPWSKLYKKKFLEVNNIMFDEVIASNDMMFSTKVGFHMQKFYVSKQTFYCITKSKGSLTTNISKTIYIARLNVYINYVKYLKAKLKKQQFKDLQINGRHLLINGFQQKIGAKLIIESFFRLLFNKVTIFEWKLLNPILILKKTQTYSKQFNKGKKYHIK